MASSIQFLCYIVFTLFVAYSSIAADTDDKTIDKANQAESLVEQQALISQLESKHGAYHSSLRQAFQDLGALEKKQGNYLKAIAAYEKALHISKVDTGVHDLAQLELVEILISLYSETRDWSGLGEKLHYLLWIHRRNFDAEDDRLVAMIERVGLWYMQAYRFHSGGEAVSYLVKADDLFNEAIDVITTQYGERARQLVNLYHSSATVNYQIANDVNDVFVLSHRDIREAMIPNKRASPYVKEVAVREYYFNQSFHKGKRSLEAVIDIHKSGLPGSVVEFAQALVYQGDYYLSLNKKWNAMRNYKKAYNILLEHKAGEQSLIAIFGEPRRVEPFTIPGNNAPVWGTETYVDSIVNIPINGWPRDIVITASNPQNDENLNKRGKHAVAATRFRPRFEEGKPVDTEGIKLRYVFRR